MSFIQEVENILESQGIKPLHHKNWVKNAPYFSIGLDDWCFPCLTEVTFVGEKNGRPIILSEGIRIVSDYNYQKLYVALPNYKTAIKKACNEVYENWRKSVDKQLANAKSA